MSISKNQIKYIQSLQRKKIRQQEGIFIVEGDKIAQECLQQEHFKIQSIFAKSSWLDEQEENLNNSTTAEIYEVSDKELSRISGLKTPNQVLLLVEQQSYDLEQERPSILQQLNLVVETLQNPGNLGTIIRIADWFGINHLFCSEDSVELYNPKVIQASMGSFLRVKVHYLPLTGLFETFNELPRYGAVLDGANVYTEQLPQAAFLVIGNESQGLSGKIQSYINHPISIPRFGQAESLNAGIATGILCAAFKGTAKK